MALTKITPQMFDTSAAGHDFNIDNGTFVVDASANRVGIGTATPSTLLDVNGTLTATTIVGTLTTAAQTNITSVGTLTGLTVSGNLTVDTTTLVVDATNNRAGIGTSSIDSDSILHLKSTQPNIYFEDTDDAKSWRLEGGSVFKLQNVTTSSEVFRMDQSGNVGIGISAMSSYYSKNLVVMADGDNTGGITIAAPATDDTTYLAFADGTSGAAAYAGYVGYAHNGDDLLLGAGGATRVTIDSTGNIGIGESNPARRLSVRRDTGITTGFNDISQFLDTTLGVGGSVSLNLGRANSTKNLGKMAFKYAGSGSNSNALNFGFYDADNLMTLLANGNVGIGTDTPSSLLSVGTVPTHTPGSVFTSSPSSFFSTTALGGTTGNDQKITIFGGGDASNVSGLALYRYRRATGTNWTTDGFSFRQEVDGTANIYNYMNFAAGKVGIGTASPGAKLEVAGNLYVGPVGAVDATTKAEMNTYNVLKLKPHNTNSTNMTIASVSNGDAMGIQVSNAAQTANWHIALNPFGGSVGIGTASPTRKLHIGGTAPGDSIIRQDATSSGTNWEIGEREAGKWMIFEDDGDSIVATFMSTGNVGIGTTAPTESLTVLGAISAKNGHEDLATHTLNSYASIVSSGTLEFTLGYNGSLAVGRVFTFTYEATSWKSWMFEIEVASTHGYTTIKSGGYNNNSNGKNIYEVGDAQNAGTLTHTNSGQHNVFTYTLNSSMIHPAFKIKYTQSGGDGAPRMDRMKLVIT